jgi:hypothetical protein
MATVWGRLSEDIGYKLEIKAVETKEYPEGQVAYSVEFYRKGERMFF